MPPDGSPFSCPCGDPLLESLRPLLEPSLCLARDGQLPHANAATLASGELAMRLLPGEFRDVHHAATLSRALFQRAVSWALFSEQWLDAFEERSTTFYMALQVGLGRIVALHHCSSTLHQRPNKHDSLWQRALPDQFHQYTLVHTQFVTHIPSS